MSYLTPVVDELMAADKISKKESIRASRLRDQALIKGLIAIAQHHGKTLQEPVKWDFKGEVLFCLSEGEFGSELAALLNTIRVYPVASRTVCEVMPNHNGCLIGHFEVEKLILNIHQQALT